MDTLRRSSASMEKLMTPSASSGIRCPLGQITSIFIAAPPRDPIGAPSVRKHRKIRASLRPAVLARRPEWDTPKNRAKVACDDEDSRGGGSPTIALEGNPFSTGGFLTCEQRKTPRCHSQAWLWSQRFFGDFCAGCAHRVWLTEEWGPRGDLVPETTRTVTDNTTGD